MPAGEMSIVTPSSGDRCDAHAATSAKFHRYSPASAPSNVGGGPGSWYTRYSKPSRTCTARSDSESANGMTLPHSGPMNSGSESTTLPAWSMATSRDSGCQRLRSTMSGLPGLDGARGGLAAS